MKKITFILFALVFATLNWQLQAQCIASFSYGSGTLTPTTSQWVQFATCNYAGDYANITINGTSDYRLQSSISTDFLTLTDAGNNVIAVGVGQIDAMALASGAYRLHIFVNETCETQNSCRITSGVALSMIPEPPVNSTCENAIALGANTVVQGTTMNSTSNQLPACSGVNVSSGPGVWYTVVGTGGMMNANTCADADFDTKIAIYTEACDSQAITCIAANDDAPNCPGFRSSVDWDSEAGVTYYIYVTGFQVEDGDFTLTIESEDVEIACLNPSQLEAIATSSDTAELTWIAGGTETTWEIVYGLQGINPDDMDAIVVNEPTYALTGLEANALYEIYVRAVCDDQVSDWIYKLLETPADEDENACGLAEADIDTNFESPFVVWFNIEGAPEGQRYDLAAGNPGFTPTNPNFGMGNVEMPYRRNSMHQGRTYEFYIRVIGEDGEVCDWVGPIEVVMPSVGSMAARATLYPNPAVNNVSIEGVNADVVQIFSNNGAVISTQKVVNGQFNVQTLPLGTYIIQITDSDGTVSTQQLIKK